MRTRTRTRVGGRSLRARLLASSVTLIAVVCAIVGAVTTVALRGYLYDRLDAGLAEAAHRVAAPPHGRPSGLPGCGSAGSTGPYDPRDFVLGAGQGPGTLGAVLGADGTAVSGAVSRPVSPLAPQLCPVDLDAAQLTALSAVPAGHAAHTVTLPGLGDYRLTSVTAARTGVRLVVGTPTRPVTDTVDRLALVIVCVTAAGLAAAGLAAAGLAAACLPAPRSSATPSYR